MSAYLIVGLDIHDHETFETYRELVAPNITAFGGRYVVRGGVTEVLEGNWSPKRSVVLEFPDMASLRRWYDSPEYEPIKALRLRSASADMIAVEGVA